MISTINVVKVRSLQTQLNTAWEQYRVRCDKYANLVDILSNRAAQRSRQQVYNDQTAEQFVVSVYNNQVSEDVKLSKEHSSPVSGKSLKSVKSGKRYTSRLTVFSSEARGAKVQAEKAELIQQQAEERSRKSIELETKRIEMEIKRTQLELQHTLELTKLEAEREVVPAKNLQQLDKLETPLTEREMCQLNHDQEGIKWSPKVEVLSKEKSDAAPLCLH